MTEDIKDRDVRTMSVPAAGKLYFGLGRTARTQRQKEEKFP